MKELNYPKIDTKHRQVPPESRSMGCLSIFVLMLVIALAFWIFTKVANLLWA